MDLNPLKAVYLKVCKEFHKQTVKMFPNITEYLAKMLIHEDKLEISFKENEQFKLVTFNLEEVGLKDAPKKLPGEKEINIICSKKREVYSFTMKNKKDKISANFVYKYDEINN